MHGFLISCCLAQTVSNMYMYEGRDYRDTSTKDQEAFDNMMAGKVAGHTDFFKGLKTENLRLRSSSDAVLHMSRIECK